MEEIIRIEMKLFFLICDVKGFLLIKKFEEGVGRDDIDNVLFDILVLKCSEILFNINWFCDNISLVEDFICDVLKDDFIINYSVFGDIENELRDNSDVK